MFDMSSVPEMADEAVFHDEENEPQQSRREEIAPGVYPGDE